MKKILVIVLFAIFLTPFFRVEAKGFDEFGYNDTARIFNGTGESWSLAKGLPADYLGIYAPDKLIMKWNAEWDRGNAENWLNPPYAAWENNEWNGKVPGGSGAVWHYKIVWVGPETRTVAGQWNMDLYVNGDSTLYVEATNIAQSGSSLSGSFTYNGGSEWAISSGSVLGDSVSFDVYYVSNPSMTASFTGTIASNGSITGTWHDVAGLSRTGTWSAPAGTAQSVNGPYWVDGGYRIWGQFETIMDQGTDPNIGPGHLWFAHAKPNGYGAFK